MCRPAVCDRCKKITWTGCGQHAEQALAGISPGNRCTCRETQPQGRQVAGT